MIREILSLTGQITGFLVNSSKTKDVGDLFGENSGYEIPWQHDEVLENLAAMRTWQEKFNPVSGRRPHAAIRAKFSKKIRRKSSVPCYRIGFIFSDTL